MKPNSRFATSEEIFTERFSELNDRFAALHKKFNLQNHEELNKERFSWADRIKYTPMYYAARMWEFPYAILEADLQTGMKVADVGCGNTPFTALLAEKVGAKMLQATTLIIFRMIHRKAILILAPRNLILMH